MTRASFVLSALLATATPAVQPPVDFSGSWTLDEARSVSATHDAYVGPVIWTITHRDREVVVDLKRGPKSYTLTFPLLNRVPSGPPDEVPSSRAYWNDNRLVTELAQNVGGQAVITREEWTLQPGGREFIVERIVKVEHGYTMRGARSYNTAKDTFVKAVP
jgi:hypothetical protein